MSVNNMYKIAINELGEDSPAHTLLARVFELDEEFNTINENDSILETEI